MSRDTQKLFKKIPAVDRLLLTPVLTKASEVHPRSLILKAVNQILDELRDKILKSEENDPLPEMEIETIAQLISERAARLSTPSLKPVVNATGVVIHTNMGRSILPETALSNLGPVAGGYSNLEYDLDRGKRGSRHTHVAEILMDLTNAEAAMVVNNNAGAVLIALETLANGREVIVSRGQLVEIGGSFRIPDVMRKSGGKMVEVGTTNKTHLKDYEEVISPDTGLLLKVHTSNFQIVGFTQEVSIAELATLGKQHRIPVMEDLGSGCLVDFSEYGIIKEPTVQETLAQGADLVTFSGDKLLGGPQAGIILGRRDLIEAIKQNPLARALRIDKLTLAALESTLRLYRDKTRAIHEIPTLKMICEPHEMLVKKADQLINLLGDLKNRNFSHNLEDGISRVGGGALPLMELKTRLICLTPKNLSTVFMERYLRESDPPIIARVEKEKVILDVRTIQNNELEIVANAVKALAALAPE